MFLEQVRDKIKLEDNSTSPQSKPGGDSYLELLEQINSAFPHAKQDWNSFIELIGQFIIEREHPETYYFTYPGLEIIFSGIPVQENVTTSIDFESHFDVAYDLIEKFEVLFRSATEQIFEDGMESDFSRELIFLVNKYGDMALSAVTRLIVTEQVNEEVASEALRWLGRMDNPNSHRSRLFLLERSLYCQSPRVRDGAALGLASLDDPHAIPDLKRAIARESYEELRKDLEQVLVQLEDDH